MADLKIEVESDIGKVKAGLKYVSKEMGKLSKGSVKTAKDVKKVSKVVKDSSGGYDKLGSSVKKTDSNMKKFTTTMNKNAGGLRRVGVDANRTAGEFQKLSKTISSLGFGKLAALYGLSDIFAKALQGASDIEETINLFNVSMGEFATSTGDYLNRISQSSGLDPTFLQEATGNYTLLAKSMGLTAKNSVVLGKSVTNLGVDLSSLMNIPLEQVMADLRSGLLGQTETVYKYGIDLTEASLKQEALRLGIQKSVTTMSQAEKMALRYSVMIRASSLAHGDFAKTIETPANQLRILSQQMTQLSRTIGTVFINTLGNVLPYINGFIMALRVLIETIAALLGYETPKFQDMSNGFSSVTDSSNELDDSIKGNTNSAKKLQKELKDLTLGFDELNIVPDQSTPDAGGTGGGGGTGGVGGEIPLPDLTEYSAQLENVRMKATEIRDRILEWLGFTKEIDPVTGKVTWRLGEGYTKLELILDIVKAIGLAFLTWKIAGLLSSLTPILTALKNIATAALTTFKTLGLWGGLKSLFDTLVLSLSSMMTNISKMAGITPTNFGIAATLVFMVARLYDLYTNSEVFRKGVERLKEIWDALWGLLKQFGSWFMDTFINPSLEGLKKFGNYLLNLLPESIRKPISDFFKVLGEIINKIDLDFVDLLTTLAGIGLLFTPAAPFGVALLAFEAITIAIRGIGAMSDETWEKVKQSVKDALVKIGEFFVNMWNTIKPILEPFGVILKDILSFLWDIVSYIGGIFIESFKFVFSFIKDYIITPFADAWKQVSQWFVENSDSIINGWELVKIKFGEVWDWIKTNILEPFQELWTKAKELFIVIIDILIKKWSDWYESLKKSWYEGIKPTLEAFGQLLKVLWEDLVKPNLDLIIKLFSDMVRNILGALGGLLDFIIGVFTGDWERAWTGVGNILKSIFNGMISIVESSINGLINGVNFFIRQINKIKLPDWLGGGGFNISEIESVNLPKLELAVGDLENKVNEVADKNKPTEMQKSLSRSSFMTGGNLVPNYSNYNRSIPQMSTGYLTERQNDYIQNGQQQTQTETIINNVLTLDGEVIWKNQEKVKAQKGFNFGNPAFSR